MSILYELEFDLDGFIESMEKQYPARRRIEQHMEKRRLREELSPYGDDEDDERPNKSSH
jgi:hypothetical protein